MGICFYRILGFVLDPISGGISKVQYQSKREFLKFLLEK